MGVVTNYLWDEFSTYGDVILETDAAGLELTRYTLGNGQLISETSAGTTEYFLSDALGSTRAMTDDAGAVTGTFAYDAFGQLVEQTGTSDTNYLYTGQQYDSSTELYSLRARYYDPGMGRFLSRDTWPYDYKNPIELNRYVYAANNPVLYSDPSGDNSGEQGLLGKVRAFVGRTVRHVFSRPFKEGAAISLIGFTIGQVGNALFKSLVSSQDSQYSFLDWAGYYLRQSVSVSTGFRAVIAMLAGGFMNAANVGARQSVEAFLAPYRTAFTAMYGHTVTGLVSMAQRALSWLYNWRSNLLRDNFIIMGIANIASLFVNLFSNEYISPSALGEIVTDVAIATVGTVLGAWLGFKPAVGFLSESSLGRFLNKLHGHGSYAGHPKLAAFITAAAEGFLGAASNIADDAVFGTLSADMKDT
ncbi:MAG: RHS repeat-associated core domain-containing protein [Anaerolineae bacterium]|nr:RHS repeat-associated core domain-containing protein [Anaerolineae bacterium]